MLLLKLSLKRHLCNVRFNEKPSIGTEKSKQHADKLHQQLEAAREDASIVPLISILNRSGFEARVESMFVDK